MATHIHHHHQQTPSLHPHRWRALTLLCLAQAMLVIDITVVNVALPSIGTDLTLSREALTWVVTGYTLCFGGLMLLGGRLTDLFGAKAIVRAGLIIFVASSLAAGLAGSGTLLLAGRLGQGVGAALLSPAALSTLTMLFHGAERHRALGAWSAVGGAGAALGVLLGGALTEGPGWQWAFFINIPVGSVIFVVLPAMLPQRRRDHGPARIDLLGALLVTAATTALVFGVVRAGDYGWSSVPTWGSLVAAAALYAGFFGYESRARQPLMRVALMVRPTILAGVFLMLVATGLLISFFFLGSLYLQGTRGFSALGTGLMFGPAAVAITAGAHLSGRLLSKVTPRAIVTVALLLAAGGAGWLTMLTPADNVYLAFLPGFTVAAFGLGAVFVIATTTAMSTVDHSEAGVASAIVNTFHELGGAIGVAVMSTVAATGIATSSPDPGAFTEAFTVCAIAAAVAGAVSLPLVPAGRIAHSGMPHAH
jgi:EmrB/QacA subfamily drug resistance transporter